MSCHTPYDGIFGVAYMKKEIDREASTNQRIFRNGYGGREIDHDPYMK